MVTTKKIAIAIEYAQKEMRKEFKHFTIKKSTKHKRRNGKRRKGNQKMTKKLQGIWKTNSRMTEGSPSLSVITLNVNELSCPIKRQRLTGWIKIHDSTLCSLQEAHLDPKTQID